MEQKWISSGSQNPVKIDAPKKNAIFHTNPSNLLKLHSGPVKDHGRAPYSEVVERLVSHERAPAHGLVGGVRYRLRQVFRERPVTASEPT